MTQIAVALKSYPHVLTAAGFAATFGCDAADLSAECRAIIADHDFRYRVLDIAERDAVILNVLHRTDARQFSVTGPDQVARWERGWGENLADFLNSGNVDALIPKYIRPNMPVRLSGNFIETADSSFELNWYAAFRSWMIGAYLTDARNVFEFGCGSGHNIPVLAGRLPGARIVGLDWARPSVEIVENLRTKLGLNVAGHHFNFFEPDHSIDVPADSVFLTVGALEQTGTRFRPFLDFTMAKRPKLVVNVEPVPELLDQHNIVDYTSIRCLAERGFMHGYLPALLEMAERGEVEIIKVHRAGLGSLMLESYAQIVWRPL